MTLLVSRNEQSRHNNCCENRLQDTACVVNTDGTIYEQYKMTSGRKNATEMQKTPHVMRENGQNNNRQS